MSLIVPDDDRISYSCGLIYFTLDQVGSGLCTDSPIIAPKRFREYLLGRDVPSLSNRYLAARYGWYLPPLKSKSKY